MNVENRKSTNSDTTESPSQLIQPTEQPLYPPTEQVVTVEKSSVPEANLPTEVKAIVIKD